MRRFMSTAVFTALAASGFVLAQSEPMTIHGEGFQHAGAIHLEMGGTVSGKVVDQNDKGISDAEVKLNGTWYGIQTCTDSSGNYTLLGVPLHFDLTASKVVEHCTI